MRAHGCEDRRRSDDRAHPEHADGEKPQQHHWTKDVADEPGSLALEEKQRNQNADADRNHEMSERRRIEL
jgi:hypothetical protein